MSNQETAIVVVSGKILDNPFDLGVVDSLRVAVERELTTRDIVVVKRVVALAPQHSAAAAAFLLAGFEVAPADDEDMQAAAILVSALAHPDGPTNVAFALGQEEPIALLRLLAGRARRFLITASQISEELGRNIEGLMPLRDLLSKEGVNYSGMVRQNWSAPDVSRVAQLTVPEKTQEAQLDKLVQAPDELAELCETQEPDLEELLRESAGEWNAELEKFVLDNGKKCSARLAVERVGLRFPGLGELYQEKRDVFRKLLQSSLRLVGDNSMNAFWLYHESHPEMRPIDGNSIKNLCIGAEVAPAVDKEIVPPLYDAPPVLSFSALAAQADTLRQYCEWNSQRIKLQQYGSEYRAEISAKDQELKELKDFTGPSYVWTIKESNLKSLTSEEFSEAARRYKTLQSALEILAQMEEEKATDLSGSLVFEALQFAADAQCAVKNFLQEKDISIGKCPVQRETFSLITSTRREHFPTRYLQHSRIEDRLTPDEVNALSLKGGELLHEYRVAVARVNELKSLERDLVGHVAQISNATLETDADLQKYNDAWQAVVETTTKMCRDFKEPPSSLRLRAALEDLLDQIPDDLEATDEFSLVVQSIELAQQDKKNSEVSNAPQSEKLSPEVQAVRSHYHGAKAVFLGGRPVEHLRSRLASKLNIDLIWPSTSHGDSLDRLSGYVKDPDVKLFLVYIPWCSHKHSLDFADIVKKNFKDFVRIRKGTSPDQIAKAICDQVSMADDDIFLDALDHPQKFIGEEAKYVE
ncbi:MAG: hypothetical protein ACI4NP_02870 [Thermoguttaceae bacterium]